MSAAFLRVYLVRHAEVGAQWRGRVYGDLDVELSAFGEEQTERMPQRFRAIPLDAVWSSDLDRAQRAAAGIALAQGVRHQVDQRLREVHRGAWRERRWEEVEAEEPGAFQRFVSEPQRLPSTGESLGLVAQRVSRAFAELRAAQPTGRVALVAHTWVIRVLLCEALGLPLAYCDRLGVETASIATVDFHPNQTLVQQLNQRDPLAPFG